MKLTSARYAWDQNHGQAIRKDNQLYLLLLLCKSVVLVYEVPAYRHQNWNLIHLLSGRCHPILEFLLLNIHFLHLIFCFNCQDQCFHLNPLLFLLFFQFCQGLLYFIRFFLFELLSTFSLMEVALFKQEVHHCYCWKLKNLNLLP